MGVLMNEFPFALGNGDEIVTFDIGGNSFRSGFVTREGRLTEVQRIPSINCWSQPGKSGADIMDAIGAYIARTVKSFWDSPALEGRRPAIAISLGAAMNAHTGKIHGSGPILGDDSTAFDLEKAIGQYLKDADITVVNDVTASLMAHSRLAGLYHARQLALITVSSGIASRILNCSMPHVPVDALLGTQGEIGHHRIAFSIDGHPISLKCDCGGLDHVNAFASGNGIKKLLGRVRDLFSEEFRKSALNKGDKASDISVEALADGLANGDALCQKILKAVTAPIAEAIKWHFMLDPEIDKLILTGGVCAVLRENYLSAVLENLSASGFYPLASGAESYWADRVILGPHSDDAGLIGAAYIARESLKIHRHEALNVQPPYRVSRQSALEYPIEVVQSVFQNEEFPQYLLRPFDRIVLVIDSNVDELYGDEIRKLLAGPKRKLETVVLQVSEKQKDMFLVMDMVSTFERLGLRRRNDLTVAAGGGVLLDVVSFACSIWRRGVPFMKLPTTLLAEIDAGIGIKTGVNFRQNKNRLGTFTAPYAVVVDPCFLKTLPDRQIRNGLSESLKIALMNDRMLFDLLEEHASYLMRTKLQCAEGRELICRSIRAMMMELSPNLTEIWLERRPDYGHTFSPIFEFELSDLEHGEAVALDMAVSTGIAVVKGILDVGDAEQVLATQHALGLPIVRDGTTVDMLVRGIHDARKHRGGRLRMPVLCGIGEAAFVDEVSEARLEEALAFVRSWSGRQVAEVQDA
jgi:3-dehydroquinate synthetase/predicted NBD/HSP70 family sugar kinase